MTENMRAENQNAAAFVPGGNQNAAAFVPGGNQNAAAFVPGGNQNAAALVPGGNQPPGGEEPLAAAPKVVCDGCKKVVSYSNAAKHRKTCAKFQSWLRQKDAEARGEPVERTPSPVAMEPAAEGPIESTTPERCIVIIDRRGGPGGCEWFPRDLACPKRKQLGIPGVCKEYRTKGKSVRQLFGGAQVRLTLYFCPEHNCRVTALSPEIAAEVFKQASERLRTPGYEPEKDGIAWSEPIYSFPTSEVVADDGSDDGPQRAILFTEELLLDIVREYLRSGSLNETCLMMSIKLRTNLGTKLARKVILTMFGVVPPVNVLMNERFVSKEQVCGIARQVGLDFTYKVGQKVVTNDDAGRRVPVRCCCSTLLSSAGYVLRVRLSPTGEGHNQVREALGLPDDEGRSLRPLHGIRYATEDEDEIGWWLQRHTQYFYTDCLTLANVIREMFADVRAPDAAPVKVKQDRFHVWRRLLGKISQYHPQKKCLVHELKLLSEALSGGKVNTVKALQDRLNAIMQRYLQPHKQAVIKPQAQNLELYTAVFNNVSSDTPSAVSKIMRDNAKAKGTAVDHPPLICGDALTYWKKQVENTEMLTSILLDEGETWKPGTNQNEGFHRRLRRKMGAQKTILCDMFLLNLEIAMCEHNAAVYCRRNNTNWKPKSLQYELQTMAIVDKSHREGIAFTMGVARFVNIPITGAKLREAGFTLGVSRRASDEWLPEDDEALAKCIQRVLTAPATLSQQARAAATKDLAKSIMADLTSPFFDKVSHWGEPLITRQLHRLLQARVTTMVGCEHVAEGDGSEEDSDSSQESLESEADDDRVGDVDVILLGDDCDRILLPRRKRALRAPAAPRPGEPVDLALPPREPLVLRPPPPIADLVRGPVVLDDETPPPRHRRRTEVESDVAPSLSAPSLSAPSLSAPSLSAPSLSAPSLSAPSLSVLSSQGSSEEGTRPSCGSAAPVVAEKAPMSAGEVREAFRNVLDGVTVDVCWKWVEGCTPPEETSGNECVWWRGCILRAGGVHSLVRWCFIAYGDGEDWSPLSDPTTTSLPDSDVEIWAIVFPKGNTTVVDGFSEDEGYLEATQKSTQKEKRVLKF
jgi:hypothetical protein